MADLDGYFDLESRYRRLRRERHYTDASNVLREMIEYVNTHSASFDHCADRIRVLEARGYMLAYEEARIRGGRQQIEFLRKAAAASTPSACSGMPCVSVGTDLCVDRRTRLSKLQARMCIEKLNAECNALKLEAALAARGFDYGQALEKRRTAATLHRSVLRLDASQMRMANQRYLEYWCHITEGYVSLLGNEFGDSKRRFAEALDIARLLDQKRCFPNYFRDLKELAAHDIYIDAVKAFRSQDFSHAKALFTKWLDLHSERDHLGDLRYDNIKAFSIVCNILERLTASVIERADWQRLDQFVEKAYVARPTWALLERLRFVRELHFRVGRGDGAFRREDVAKEIAAIAGEWKLLVPDTVLLGSDRTAGLEREVAYPAFLAILDDIEVGRDNWKDILSQNVYNLLWLIADYEWCRYVNPPTNDVNLPRDKTFQPLSHNAGLSELVGLITRLLERRDRKHLMIFQAAGSRLTEIDFAIGADNFDAALQAEHEFVRALRSWPHVIQIKRQVELPTTIFWDEDEPALLARETVAKRVWDQEPDEVVFEGPQDLKPDRYYYLRPRWNVRKAQRYRIRHEHFLESDVPRWLTAVGEGLTGKGVAPRRRFQDWIFQFPLTERAHACRLLAMLKFYGQEDVRRMWLDLYRRLLPPQAKSSDVGYFSVGHTAKSGQLNNYYFRQAMSTLPTNERSFDFKSAFRSIAEVETDVPTTVVFVDDFIGTGIQAVRVLANYFRQHPWLADCAAYYCALVGFEHGISSIASELQGLLREIFVAERLKESDRAFSEANDSWVAESDRKACESWAAEIGRQVLAGRVGYDPATDNLGWGGSQALVAFFYNIPNNTLPLFWGSGERDGKRWKPLFDRFD